MDGFGVTDLFRVLDLTGVFANAVLGGVIARRERLDPVGFMVLAVLSGLGGGMIRDTLLQAGPPIALTDLAYLVTALAGAAFAYLLHVEGRVWHRVWPVLDAIALGCWAAAGASRTLAVGLGWLPAILLGTITAVGGGAVRDIVLRRIPSVLGGNTLYATCAALASAVLVLLSRLGHPSAGMITALAVGGLLCLLARWRGWILPSADAWSPANVVPARLVPTRFRARRRRPPRAPDQNHDRDRDRDQGSED
ncbi:MAG: trimeric intracellular cation channel family protein [Propionibacteriaceae bacterium]